MGVLVLVALSSGCISVGGSFHDLSNNSSKLNHVNMVNGTYYVGNISFKCPDNWYVEADNQNSDILAYPNNSANIFPFLSFAPQFELSMIPNTDFSNYDMPDGSDYNSSSMMIDGNINGQIIPDNVTVNGSSSNYTVTSINSSVSDQEIADIMRNSVEFGWNEISNSTITIDGKTAYETTFMVNSLSPPIIDKRFEQIIFVKNGYTYVMFLQAQDWDFDKEKQSFDIILNSFKVQ